MKYIAAAVVALAIGMPAQAALQTYEFTASVSGLGNINHLSWDQTNGGVQAGSSISLGDSIAGRFTYDSSWKPNSTTSWYWALTSYHYTPAPSTFFSFTILPSGQKVSTADPRTPGGYMRVDDAKFSSPYGTDAITLGAGPGLSNEFYVRLVDARSTWLLGGVLPKNLSLSDLTSASVHQTFERADGNRILLSANMTSLTNVTVAAVPEPGTWVMLLAGLSILGVSVRRKRA